MDHIYNGGCCIFCNRSAMRISINDMEGHCEDRPSDVPFSYSTSTGNRPVQSHGMSFANR